jgi:hypothetical protein
MKLKNLILSFAALISILPACAQTPSAASFWQKAKKPKNISVLYLGGMSDWNNGEMGTPKKFDNPKKFEQSVAARTKAFGSLLRKHFGKVTVIDAKDYKPSMSDDYDVTIFDGIPPQLTNREFVKDKSGEIVDVIPATYLPADYHAASITIAELGERISQPLGIKNDWYCLCLDADAHSMNLQHPIFNGPFKTKITLRKRPTPEDAFHYAYYSNGYVPDSVMMWRVQKIGYKDDKDFRIGMVSRPWGYVEGDESESISSGVCAKTIDAVALGRHGNFFTWGFSASPLYMTNEAKTVFCNVVAYMANFKTPPVARKYNERIATSSYLKEQEYLCKKSSYYESVHSDSIWREEQRKGYETALAKKQRGDSLNSEDKMYLQYYNPNEKERTYGEYLKFYMRNLYDIFGEDESEYLHYYEKYGPYLYGGKGSYELVLDQDAWAWKIPIGQIQLLDKAITSLEKGMEVERANRILSRYTLCEFTSPQQWRNWFNTYRNRIFFTEAGGWYYMVKGDPSLPGNDYSVAKKRKDSQKTDAALTAEQSQQPTATEAAEPLSSTNPVSLQAKAQAEGKKVNIEVTIDFYPGFHVYSHVGKNDPYIPLSVEVEVPSGAKLEDVALPQGKKFGGEGTYIYDSKTTIKKTLSCSSLPDSVTVTVGYQTCDDKVCQPPVEKTMHLKVNH